MTYTDVLRREMFREMLSKVINQPHVAGCGVIRTKGDFDEGCTCGRDAEQDRIMAEMLKLKGDSDGR